MRESARLDAGRWPALLKQFSQSWMAEHDVLRLAAGRSTVLLHGSTMQGVDDAWSDLDVWVLVPQEVLAAVDAASVTRFFEFSLEGKPGHFNIDSMDQFRARVQRCDLPLICELRCSAIMADAQEAGRTLIERARRPMTASVQHAWFRHHYVEMRSEHRACDNPIERGDALAVMMAMTGTITHALQAAMVLDGQPYPYVKWLRRAAEQTPTGRQIAAIADQMVELLARDTLRRPGPERQHPLSMAMREMRRVLIETAQQRGIDEPWLREWYLYIDAAGAGIGQVCWDD
jgi:hypothetical protein